MTGFKKGDLVEQGSFSGGNPRRGIVHKAEDGMFWVYWQMPNEDVTSLRRCGSYSMAKALSKHRIIKVQSA